ncbi:MAG: hypothetical protein QOC96_123 [Acidobacteriota bacterium]|jgi:hypothetical protein|nr:hypothetical protein [Acidobacteriota bacterium]
MKNCGDSRSYTFSFYIFNFAFNPLALQLHTELK